MAKFKLGLETLSEVDNGVAAVVFDREVQKAVADCRDRPALAKPREITIKVKVLPHKSDSDDIWCALEVSGVKMPGTATDPVKMQTNSKNDASFQSLSNDNPRQADLGLQTPCEDEE